MSTGQRRKLLFMLALLDKSALYIFDEILVNLSREDIIRAVDLLKARLDDSIIVLSSHHEAILNVCDSVYEIHHQTITRIR